MALLRTDGFYCRTGKRIIDILIAAPALLVCGPLFLLISAAILLCSGRPVLFRQERVGRFGRRFRIIKFRTMVPGAAAGGFVTTSRDPRVTRIGALLRKWKLDELPQFWNVLRGDMSLVGPRADVPDVMDRLRGADRNILQLRPGITGPATIAYRNEEELLSAAPDPDWFSSQVIFPDKVRINRAYLDELSFRTDVSCLIQTVAAVIRHLDGDVNSCGKTG